MHDVVVGIEHFQDRRAGGTGAVRRIDGVVVEHRLAAGSHHWGAVRILLLRQFQISLCYLAAIPLGAAWLDVHCAKQTHRQRAAIALTARRCGGAVEQVITFFFGVKRVDDVFARSNETARVGADV